MMYLALLLRAIVSPLMYWFFRKTIYKGPLPHKWHRVKNYHERDYEALLNKFPYKHDFWFADFSPEEPDFFFLPRKHNRDCDDWARMWAWWAVDKGYKTWVVMIWDVKGFFPTKGHKFCVYQKDGLYVLADYFIRDRQMLFRNLLEHYKTDDHWLATGRYEELRWVRVPFPLKRIFNF